MSWIVRLSNRVSVGHRIIQLLGFWYGSIFSVGDVSGVFKMCCVKMTSSSCCSNILCPWLRPFSFSTPCLWYLITSLIWVLVVCSATGRKAARIHDMQRSTPELTSMPSKNLAAPLTRWITVQPVLAWDTCYQGEDAHVRYPCSQKPWGPLYSLV